MNPQGAARIAFGQYTAWQVGMHGRSNPETGKSPLAHRHEALVQVCNVKVDRDLNRDMQWMGDVPLASH